MSQDEELSRSLEGIRPLLEAPIGIYVVTTDGNFIEYNDRVREILEISPDAREPTSIREFYHDPEEREVILEEMKGELRFDTKKWLQKTIRLKVNGREKFIKDYSRAIFGSSSRDAIGFLCCMINVTEEILFNRLFESSPVGIYKLDERKSFVEVSKAVVQMLGYDSEDELLGKRIKEFFSSEEEENKFLKAIKDSKTVNKLIVELKKKNELRRFFSLSAFPVRSDRDKYIGLAGTMVDVNTEALYQRILESVQVGLFMISERDGKEIITDCNKQFANLNGFGSVDQAIGSDLRDLHASEESYQSYMRALEEGGEPPPGYQLKMVTPQGKTALYEVNSLLLFDSNGNRIGRAGVMRDISEKVVLKHRVDELTKDIGRVLHTYSSSIVKIQNSLDIVLQSMEPDPFKKGYNVLPEHASRELFQPANRLAKSVEHLAAIAGAPWAAGALPAAKWQRLSELAKLLRSYESNNRPEAHLPILRTAAFNIMEIWGETEKKKKLPNDITRQVRNNAQELLRLCNQISLHQLLDLTIAMENSVSALRDFVTTEKRKYERKGIFKVSSLISQAISHLNDFASNRRVDFRHLERGSTDAVVEVNERDVVRALDNLLHNAIKYSWERKKGESPWISIHTSVKEEHVQIEIQNWGVPIPKDEIEFGRIFEAGFRGRFSSDRGRMGTGIGLADARQVAQEHGGDLLVKSVPAGFNSETDYTQPFLTTAILNLRLYYNQGAKI